MSKNNPILCRIHLREPHPKGPAKWWAPWRDRDDSTVNYSCRMPHCTWTHWGFFPLDISCGHDYARQHLVEAHNYRPCDVCGYLIDPDHGIDYGLWSVNTAHVTCFLTVPLAL